MAPAAGPTGPTGTVFHEVPEMHTEQRYRQALRRDEERGQPAQPELERHELRKVGKSPFAEWQVVFWWADGTASVFDGHQWHGPEKADWVATMEVVEYD